MKWLVENPGKRVSFALRRPGCAVGTLVRELTLADERFLARITGASPGQIRRYLDEPISAPWFAHHLRNARHRFEAQSIVSADLFAKKVLLQYAAVRALAPERVVETGVANGVSSAYLLLALNKNGHGELHSVGLADVGFLPVGQELGWIVPQGLREPWKVHVGDTREVLPSLLSALEPIDMFIHDSDHSYEHMMWEFDTAFPRLRSGGLLVSDDALWNSAFEGFGRRVCEETRILRGVGFLRRTTRGRL